MRGPAAGGAATLPFDCLDAIFSAIGDQSKSLSKKTLRLVCKDFKEVVDTTQVLLLLPIQ